MYGEFEVHCTYPLVADPLLAIARIPRLSCVAAPLRSYSSRNGWPQIDSPPAPVPVGSPVWTLEDRTGEVRTTHAER